MGLAAFASVALIHLLAAMSPGPSFVVSARTAVAEGLGPAMGLAVGFGLGAVLWAGAAMAGLALLFDLVPALFAGLKIVGGLFLVYIAVMMWRHAATALPELPPDTPPRSTAAAVRLGFMTFVANPKPAVFFSAVFVGLVPAETPLMTRIALLGIIFLNETVWYVLVGWLFSRQGPRGVYLRLKSWIDRVFGGLIALFGLKIALS